MRILVTGLCLQGNKGGPALALALMGQLRRQLGEVEFTFAVPAGEQWPFECKWAERFGVGIVERPNIPPFWNIKRFSDWPVSARQSQKWLRVARRCDVVVDMTALTYVGPPAGKISNLLTAGRWVYFWGARFARRPMLAWTQSYGPFSTPLVRRVAKCDLSRQPVIFCRGQKCLDDIADLLPEKKAMSFPDVALSLEYPHSWGREYIENRFSTLNSARLVTLSPSTVLYNKSKSDADGNRHYKDLISLCRSMIDRGYSVLLVPHSYYPSNSTTAACDTALAKEIAMRFAGDEHLAVVEDDLSPMELKSIISSAFIHLGARYHSIVAALSTAVPCISLSWHDKYTDVMGEYGLAEYVVDAERDGWLPDILKMFDDLVQQRDAVSDLLTRRHSEVLARIEENAEIFAKLIREAAK